ncbi:MAG: hypothetical protein LBU40_02015 [Methanobrevibacter sp.]|nr:hypothetical protein [Methanobrevibacter sp.]
MNLILEGKLKIKDKEISKILLGTAPFTAEGYFGHRSRLYQLDLYDNPENIAKIIIKSYELGIRGINLNTDPILLKAYDIAIENGVKMDVVGIIGKSDVNYMFPDFEKAKKANWSDDLEKLLKYKPSIILIDEFIVDSYDWELLSEILGKINEKGAIAGLISSFPFKTTKKLLNSPILDLFQIYMIPENKLGYMLDTDTFLEKERKELKDLVSKLNKTIIINKILAAGVQSPEEGFEFLKTLDYANMICIGISSEKEAIYDFNLLKNL